MLSSTSKASIICIIETEFILGMKCFSITTLDYIGSDTISIATIVTQPTPRL